MSWFCNLCGSDTSNNNKELYFPLTSKRSIPPGKYRSFASYNNHFYSPYNRNAVPLTNIKSPNQNDSQIEIPKPQGAQLYEPKNNFICFFCHGQNCKSENFKLHPNPAIMGLHSDLFVDCIYASQRPSNYLIFKYNLIQTFKEKEIKLIINCQIPGEHAICGPVQKLDKESGFAYSPALFRSEGITVKICGWEDFGVPHNYEIMLEIVRDMTKITKIKKKKVLVHCHAGNGRTGLVIACYLVYNDPNLTYESAIKLLRAKRPKSVERAIQEEYVKNFEMYIRQKRAIFSNKKQNIFTLIKNQIDLTITPIDASNSIIISSFNYKSHNSNIVNINYVPKLLYYCFEQIVQLIKSNNKLISDLYKAINGENDINDSTYSSITNIIDQVNQNDYSSIPKCENIVILTELLFIWLNECVVNIINPKKVNKIYSTGLNETSEKETKGKCMGDVISNFTQESEENIMEVLDYITDTFSKNEYETLKYISLFLLLIYPLNDENKNEKLMNEYYLAEQKLSIFCLGYNLDIFIQTEDNIENEKTTVEQTKNLLEMFMFFNKKNHKDGIIDDNNKANKEMNNIDEQKQYEIYLELKKKFEQNENKNQIYNTMLLSTVRGKTDPFFNETRNDIVKNKERYNIK